MTPLLANALVLGFGLVSALILLRAFVKVLSRDFADTAEEEA